MGIQIKLDGSAVSALIENNDEFRLELQRAVVAEVVRKSILPDFSSVLRTIQPELIDELTRAIRQDEGVKAEIDNQLSALVTNIRSETYGRAYLRELSAEVNSLISSRIKTLIDTKITEESLRVDKIVRREVDDLIPKLEADLQVHLTNHVNYQMYRKIGNSVAERIQDIVNQVNGQEEAARDQSSL